ncbi:MAG: hypothetical protein M1814_000906 [Vezdaea aestivalis]|nr:MAG: hypothetical protein M1814_000906 [Vezdaea aestivalis]
MSCATQRDDKEFLAALERCDVVDRFQSFRANAIKGNESNKRKRTETTEVDPLDEARQWLTDWRSEKDKSLPSDSVELLANIISKWDRTEEEIHDVLDAIRLTDNQSGNQLIDFICERVKSYEQDSKEYSVRSKYGQRRLNLFWGMQAFELYRTTKNNAKRADAINLFASEVWGDTNRPSKIDTLRRLVRLGQRWAELNHPDMLLAIKGDGASNKRHEISVAYSFFETHTLDKIQLDAVRAYIKTLKIYGFRQEFSEIARRFAYPGISCSGIGLLCQAADVIDQPGQTDLSHGQHQAELFQNEFAGVTDSSLPTRGAPLGELFPNEFADFTDNSLPTRGAPLDELFPNEFADFTDNSLPTRGAPLDEFGFPPNQGYGFGIYQS